MADMQARHQGGEDRVVDFDEQFCMIEKRVRALIAQKTSLTARVKELEQELIQTRRMVREFEHYHSKELHIREKIEHVLNALESVALKK